MCRWGESNRRSKVSRAWLVSAKRQSPVDDLDTLGMRSQGRYRFLNRQTEIQDCDEARGPGLDHRHGLLHKQQENAFLLIVANPTQNVHMSMLSIFHALREPNSSFGKTQRRSSLGRGASRPGQSSSVRRGDFWSFGNRRGRTVSERVSDPNKRRFIGNIIWQNGNGSQEMQINAIFLSVTCTRCLGTQISASGKGVFSAYGTASQTAGEGPFRGLS